PAARRQSFVFDPAVSTRPELRYLDALHSAEHKRRAPLEKLRDRHLVAYQRCSRTRDRARINQDYADFVSFVHPTLAGLDKALSAIHTPVTEILAQIDDALADAGEQLRSRSQAAQKEAAQRSGCRLPRPRGQAGALAGRAPSAASSPPGQQLPVSLERCAAAPTPASRHLHRRAPAARAAASARLLERRLADTPGHSGGVDGFAGLGRPDQALEIYRELTDTLQQQQSCRPPSPPCWTSPREQRDAWASLLDPAGLTRHFDFLGGAVFPELARHLIDELPMLFNPGNPDRFHQRYSLTVLEFLPQFQALLPASAACQPTGSSRESSTWPYPPARGDQQPGPGAVPPAACPPALPAAPPAASKRLSAALAALSRVWCPEVHLPALTGRFWKLTLLIICRPGGRHRHRGGGRQAALCRPAPLADADDADEAGDAGSKSAERDQLFLTALTDCLARWDAICGLLDEQVCASLVARSLEAIGRLNEVPRAYAGRPTGSCRTQRLPTR
uniref:COG2 domain-containing protein n=1 Tax=Macrostomum lignano TaxID=282301 RepID=A0A1I8F6E4_9PLAT